MEVKVDPGLVEIFVIVVKGPGTREVLVIVKVDAGIVFPGAVMVDFKVEVAVTVFPWAVMVEAGRVILA